MKSKAITSAIILVFFLQNFTKADSPITSTDIYKAYNEVDMVKYARKTGKMNEEIANYLHSKDVKIDTKAAVINSIGWSIDGTKNAKSYCKLIFNKSMKNLDVNSIDADDLFCIGYLQVMDDYFHPLKATPYIEKAYDLNGKSFTIAIIYALIKTQSMMNDQSNWCEMWNVVYKVFDDKSIYSDMKEEAKKIIWDYMINYKC